MRFRLLRRLGRAVYKIVQPLLYWVDPGWEAAIQSAVDDALYHSNRTQGRAGGVLVRRPPKRERNRCPTCSGKPPLEELPNSTLLLCPEGHLVLREHAV